MNQREKEDYLREYALLKAQGEAVLPLRGRQGLDHGVRS